MKEEIKMINNLHETAGQHGTADSTEDSPCKGAAKFVKKDTEHHCHRKGNEQFNWSPGPFKSHGPSRCLRGAELVKSVSQNS